MSRVVKEIERLIKGTDLILDLESDEFCYLDSETCVFAFNQHSTCGTPEEVLEDLKRGMTKCIGKCENDDCKIGK